MPCAGHLQLGSWYSVRADLHCQPNHEIGSKVMTKPSSPPMSTERAGAAKHVATASAVAMLVVGAWVWNHRTLPRVISGGMTVASTVAEAAAPADQPGQQPELPTPDRSRLAMPWLARGHPTPVPSLTAVPSQATRQLLVPSTALEVVDGLALIGSGTVLQTVDVRDPHAPRLLGRSADSGRPNAFVALDIQVMGTTAFMLCLDEGAEVTRDADNSIILVFDIANPSAPRLLQDLGLRQIAFALFAQDDWLYVGGWYGESVAAIHRGVLAIDARQRGALQRGAFLDTDSFIWDTARLDKDQVVVVGAAASDPVDSDHASLQVLSLAQPGRPELLRSLGDAGRRFSGLSSVSIVRGRAYAVTPGGQILVIDVASGHRAEEVVELQFVGHRSCSTAFMAMTQSVGAMLGLCGDEGEDLVTFAPIDGDISGESLTVAPLGAMRFSSSGSHRLFYKPMAFNGDYLLILDSELEPEALRIVDLSAPESPTLVGHLR